MFVVKPLGSTGTGGMPTAWNQTLFKLIEVYILFFMKCGLQANQKKTWRRKTHQESSNCFVLNPGDFIRAVFSIFARPLILAAHSSQPVAAGGKSRLVFISWKWPAFFSHIFHWKLQFVLEPIVLSIFNLSIGPRGERMLSVECIFFSADSAPWYFTLWHDFEATRGCRSIFTPFVAKKISRISSLRSPKLVQDEKHDIKIPPSPHRFCNFQTG